MRNQIRNNERPNWASSRKKLKKSMCSRRRSWADLPEELLDVIASNLNIADYLSFGRVCRSWRLCVSEYKHKFMASKPPLFFFVSTTNKSWCFWEIATGIRYKKNLPDFACNFRYGTVVSSGYLILKDQSLKNFWVVNPITGHELVFSGCPHPICPIIGDGTIFASIGSQDQDFLIVLNSTEHQKLQFCTSRDNQWKVYSYSNKGWHIKDIVVFDGRIVVLTNDSQIGIFNVRSSDLMFLKLKCPPDLRSVFVRLVACQKQLLIVDCGPPVKIYTINFSKMEWINVKHLGEDSLFLGQTDGLCFKMINPTKWGGQSNCMYILSRGKICHLFSLNNTILKSFDIVEEGTFPATLLSGYFLRSQTVFSARTNSIDNVRDD